MCNDWPLGASVNRGGFAMIEQIVASLEPFAVQKPVAKPVANR